MCHLHRKDGGKFGKSELWKGEEGTRLVLSQWKVKLAQRGQAVQEISSHLEKGNTIPKTDGNCSANITASHLKRLVSSVILLSGLKSRISSTDNAL
jgi:hypothetical protein